ncbi:hypothetical protein [Streptomyces antibioticus]|uniref:hypothetical protein n=1 Tax=Streptomyces antibioticus TaxID=1890 RepID=UPI00378E2C84
MSGWRPANSATPHAPRLGHALVEAVQHLTGRGQEHRSRRREFHPAGRAVQVRPAHVDPAVALHDTVHLVDGPRVFEAWPVGMRGWR